MVVEVGGEKKLRRILPFWRCCGLGTGDLAKGSEAFNNPLAWGVRFLVTFQLLPCGEQP